MIRTSRWNQWGQSWSNMKLVDDKPMTLGSDGCYITSLTMGLPNRGILNPDGSFMNPGQVLNRLKAVGGLNNDGLLTYDGVERAFPQLSFYDRIYTTNDPSSGGSEMQASVAIMKVKRLLELGQPTILCVDNLKNDGIPDHAVLAHDFVSLGQDKYDFLINDPDGGKQMYFTSKYGDPMTKLYGYVAIIGQAGDLPSWSTEGSESAAIAKISAVKEIIERMPYSEENRLLKMYSKEAIDALL